MENGERGRKAKGGRRKSEDGEIGKRWAAGQLKRAAMGLPPSVMGTGREALTSSLAGLMPRAA